MNSSAARPPLDLRPDDPALVDSFARRRAAYVHIPFCARVCPYCDFAVVEGADHLVERYVAAMLSEIWAEDEWGPLDAVFIGGGTPSHIEPRYIATILEALDSRFSIAPGAEISIEANPEDWTSDRSEELRSTGVDRVSFGAQSLSEPTLTYLGRQHSPEQIAGAVARARASGFRSVSVDLIYGAPAEPLEAWQQTVDGVLALPVDHVSAYALTVERGTPLSRAVQAGAAAPDPDHQADAYDYACRVLAGAGLVHYEVSNWAQPGHACAYNLIVWAQGEYLGFGLGAHRHRAGRRSWNVRRLDAYIGRGGRGVEASGEELRPLDQERERLVVGMRRRAGVAAGDLGRRWSETDEFIRLRSAGIVARHGGRIVVLDPLRTDTAARSLVGLPAENPPHAP